MEQTPFGEVTLTTEAIQMPMRFPGQYADLESGLNYNYFRDYDPSLGRYIQSDPIGLRGGVNMYGYVFASPANVVDADGQFACAGLCILGATITVGAVGGIVTQGISDIVAGEQSGPEVYFSAAIAGSIGTLTKNPVAGSAAGGLVQGENRVRSCLLPACGCKTRSSMN
jgi:RHS repeat-associated protein